MLSVLLLVGETPLAMVLGVGMLFSRRGKGRWTGPLVPLPLLSGVSLLPLVLSLVGETPLTVVLGVGALSLRGGKGQRWGTRRWRQWRRR